MVRETGRLDKMGAPWPCNHITDRLPQGKMTETTVPDTATSFIAPEAHTNYERYRVPGQYIYEGLLLGAGIPPGRMEEIREMRTGPNDVIISSYPKTGTTLLQEIVWLINHDGDIELANQSFNYERILFMEFSQQASLDKNGKPRHFKTHVPHRFLPKHARTMKAERRRSSLADVKNCLPVVDVKNEHLNPEPRTEETEVNRIPRTNARNPLTRELSPLPRDVSPTKVVYILRNPKDVMVSYFHFYRMCIPLGNYKGTWNDFFQMFVNNDGKLYYGNMFDHMLSYWKRRDEPNLHLVFYEDILKHPRENVRKIAEFLEKDLSSEQVESIVEATSFKAMKQNPKTNWSSLTSEVDLSISPFMRRGVVGDWKEHFTPAQNEIFDRMAAAKLRNSGLSFSYE